MYSDVGSVISLSESLPSEKCFSEFISDDRWSLCSFASRTSCNSRYTSIETLLDQTNRKPIVKSSSKLLNVARYFTSSKLRRKFTQKKKQKSLLLRKFSVIEEYKQKGNSSFANELSDAGCDSRSVQTSNKPRLERIPTIDERIQCTTFDVSESHKSKYFNVIDCSRAVNSKVLSAGNTSCCDETSLNDLSASISEGMLEEFVKRLDECVISNIPSEKAPECLNESSNSVSGVSVHDAEMNASLLNVCENSVSSHVRSFTPPLSEMIPYAMSPPSKNLTSVNTSVESIGRKASKIEFERNFLKTLRRKHVGEYFSIANSPEIRRLGMQREHSKYCDTLTSMNSNQQTNVRDTISLSAAHIDKRDSSDVNLDLSYGLEADSSFNYSKPVNTTDSINFFVCTNTNKSNSNVRIITADDNCNILPEALTPSRLLMHANNTDRNISEGDKEDDVLREPVIVSDTGSKIRSLSDTVATFKLTECNKEASQDKESISTSSLTDFKGYNLIHRENIELMEYPFLTLSMYPEDFIIHLGGTVSARSVKLLDRISNPEEPETRDAWWTELRIEIKSHMRALACNAVLNYTENTSICEEVCLLSATGTAALVKVYDRTNVRATDDVTSSKSVLQSEVKSEETPNANCSIFHIPYRKSSLPFPVNIKTCNSCRKGFVADVTFVTIEPQDKMPVVGQSSFIHAFVYRHKRDCRSELNAREISDGLPFLEYELNRQLINKLRIKGMNAMFGLNVHVSVGEKMIAAYATGTAVLLSVLPAPPELTLATHSRAFLQHPNSRKKLSDISKIVEDTVKQNKIHYQLVEMGSELNTKTDSQSVTSDFSIQDQYPDLEYFANLKQTCMIEVDDEDDLETIAQLIDSNPPQGFFISSTEKMLFGSLAYLPKKNIQLLAQVYRYRIPSNTTPAYFNKYFHRIVQALYMKIHHRIPCSLNKVSFKINIPDSDELQIRIVGMALALKESDREMESISTSCSSVSELADDIIFGIDGEKSAEKLEALSTLTPLKRNSRKRERRTDIFDADIQITSLSFIPGANIAFYLGNLNFVFIRESSMAKDHPGGANNFVNNFLSDIMAVVKSHAAGIGGNAVVNFFLNECLLTTHSHKNQCQCLMHVGGDVVRYIARNA